MPFPLGSLLNLPLTRTDGSGRVRIEGIFIGSPAWSLVGGRRGEGSPETSLSLRTLGSLRGYLEEVGRRVAPELYEGRGPLRVGWTSEGEPGSLPPPLASRFLLSSLFLCGGFFVRQTVGGDQTGTRLRNPSFNPATWISFFGVLCIKRDRVR